MKEFLGKFIKIFLALVGLMTFAVLIVVFVEWNADFIRWYNVRGMIAGCVVIACMVSLGQVKIGG